MGEAKLPRPSRIPWRTPRTPRHKLCMEHALFRAYGTLLRNSCRHRRQRLANFASEGALWAASDASAPQATRSSLTLFAQSPSDLSPVAKQIEAMCEANIASFHAVTGRVNQCLIRSCSVNMMMRGILRGYCVARCYCGSNDSEAL